MVIIFILCQMCQGDYEKQINYPQTKLNNWGFLYSFFVVWSGISELPVLLVCLCSGVVINLILTFPNNLVSNSVAALCNNRVQLNSFNDQYSHHIETSRLICFAYQLTGFNMMRTLVFTGLNVCGLWITTKFWISTSEFYAIVNFHNVKLKKKYHPIFISLKFKSLSSLSRMNMDVVFHY